MAVKFLEPGGDATSNVAVTTANGFWQFINNTPTIATDYVHGNHINSIRLNNTDLALSPDGVARDAGTRISMYVYVAAFPTGTTAIFNVSTSGGGREVVFLKITSGGILRLTDELGVQIGTDGATLSTGLWYRISLAYTITSTVANRFELFVNGASSISITNATLTRTATSTVAVGWAGTNDATVELRVSDIYVDDSAALTDPGNIWVTAKRPKANGTANNFVTQIGSGGSGYGSGHSPQVNERPASTSNGWSVAAVGATVEEYNIEGRGAGDMNITNCTVVDYVGWVNTKALVGETASVILNGATSAQAITSTTTVYTKVAGSSTYPAGTGADIGLQTDATATTVSLYDCGVMVAFIGPPRVVGNDMLMMFR